ncbi:MAG: polysaccharide biosynthesis protein, partial [Planctomycetaceae bacterium]
MRHRMAAVVPTYAGLFAIGWYAAFLLRFDFALPGPTSDLLAQSLPLVLLIKLLVCYATGEYHRTFRYASLSDVLNVVLSATVAAGVIFVVNLGLIVAAPELVRSFQGAIPRSVILIDWMLTVLACGLLRTGFRFYREVLRPLWQHREKKRTLIYRSNRAGIGILRTLQAHDSEFRVVGFADRQRADGRSRIAGVPLYPVSAGWDKLARKLRAEQVLIPSSTPGQTVREIVRDCAAANLKTHIIPSVGALVDGQYKLAVRDVTISDLLRRPPAQLDMAAIRKYVTGRRVLVTGAAGSIGSELCRQVLALGPQTLVFLDQSETGLFHVQQELDPRSCDGRLRFIVADVTDAAAMTRTMTEHRPHLVFHAAAYKHVPLMEHNPQEAIRNNVLGTRAVVDLADALAVEHFVFISTDKAVRPTSVMGATKLVAEKYVQSKAGRSNTRFITVRFGNVLDSAGSVVPTFRRQIEAGGPVTVTHPEMQRYFMTIPEAVQLVLQAGAVGRSGDVLILEMGEPVKIVDLAKDMIILCGLKCPEDVEIVFTGVRPGEKLFEELFY